MSLEGFGNNSATLSGINTGIGSLILPSTTNAISVGGDIGLPGRVLAKDIDNTLHWDTVADITIPDGAIVARMINANLGDPVLDTQGTFNLTTNGDLSCDEIVARRLNLTEDFVTRNIDCEDILCQNVDMSNGRVNHALTGVSDITASGDITMRDISGRDLTGSGTITAPNFVSSVNIQGVNETLSGNLSAVNISNSGTTTTTGLITGGSGSFSGDLSATGDITARDLTSSRSIDGVAMNITGATTTAGITDTGGISTTTLTASGNISGADISGANATITGDTTTQNIQVNGLSRTTGITNTGNIGTTTLSSSGLITSNGITNTGNISSGTLQATTTITCQDLTSTGEIDAVLGDFSGTLTTAGITDTGGITTTTIGATGNITTTADISSRDLTASRNITGQALEITGNGQITGNLVVNGNLDLVGVDLINLVIENSIKGTNGLGGAQTYLLDTTTGTITATGNISTTADIGCRNLQTTGLITSTGIANTGTLTTTSLTASANVGGATLSTTGNGTIGGQLNVTGAIVGQGEITTAGELAGATLDITNNAEVHNNLTIDGLTTTQNIGAVDIGCRNLQTTGTITSTGIANTGAITSTTLTTTGAINSGADINTTADIFGRNITSSSAISGVAMNITGATTTAGITDTGGITTTTLGATGNITTTTDIGGRNIESSGTLTASGVGTGLNVVNDATIGGDLSVVGNIVFDGDLAFNDLQVDTFTLTDHLDGDAVKITFNPNGNLHEKYFFRDELQVGSNEGETTSRLRINNRGLINQMADTTRPTLQEVNTFRTQIHIRNNSASTSLDTTLGGSVGRATIPSVTLGGTISGTRQYANLIDNNITFVGNTDLYAGTFIKTPSQAPPANSRAERGLYMNSNIFFNTDDSELEGFSVADRTICRNLDLTDTSNRLPGEAQCNYAEWRPQVQQVYEITTLNTFIEITNGFNLLNLQFTPYQGTYICETTFFMEAENTNWAFGISTMGDGINPPILFEDTLRLARFGETEFSDLIRERTIKRVLKNLTVGQTYRIVPVVSAITSDNDPKRKLHFRCGGAPDTGGREAPYFYMKVYPSGPIQSNASVRE